MKYPDKDDGELDQDHPTVHEDKAIGGSLSVQGRVEGHGAYDEVLEQP